MTRYYQDLHEAMNEIQRDIVEMGITVHPATMQNKNVEGDSSYDTRELQNYSFCVLDMSDKSKFLLEQGDNRLPWCMEEFKERIDPNFKNPGKAWKIRENVWKEFLRPQSDMREDDSYNEDDYSPAIRYWDQTLPDDGRGVFEYTYNERLQWQIAGIIKELKENPDTRQAIILVHNREIDADRMRKFRIPCSISYQFMIRYGKLDIIYYLRSSDYNTHLSNDLWLADELRNHIAKEVGVQPGRLFCNIGSLHVYRGYGTGGKHVF